MPARSLPVAWGRSTRQRIARGVACLRNVYENLYEMFMRVYKMKCLRKSLRNVYACLRNEMFTKMFTTKCLRVFMKWNVYENVYYEMFTRVYEMKCLWKCLLRNVYACLRNEMFTKMFTKCLCVFTKWNVYATCRLEASDSSAYCRRSRVLTKCVQVLPRAGVTNCSYGTASEGSSTSSSGGSSQATRLLVTWLVTITCIKITVR